MAGGKHLSKNGKIHTYFVTFLSQTYIPSERFGSRLPTNTLDLALDIKNVGSN